VVRDHILVLWLEALQQLFAFIAWKLPAGDGSWFGHGNQMAPQE
jgi:hypothetical protein